MSAASSSHPAKLFLFGASGRLGAEFVHVLTSAEHSDKLFQVTALIRGDSAESKDEKKSVHLTKLKAAGGKLQNGDVEKAEVSEIAKWVSGHDIVLSALPDQSVELKVIEAVKLAGVEWYIPGIFGSDVTKAYYEPVPVMAKKKAVIDAVQASGLNYFIVFNYVFTQFLLSPVMGVDIANSTITAGGAFSNKVSTTSMPDIVRLTVEALIHRNESHVKNQYLHFVGDTLTFDELCQLVEKHFKKNFQKVVISKEELSKLVAEDTEVKNIPARFRRVFSEQKGAWIDKKDSWNVQYAKHIKVSTVKEYLEALKED